jgi:hypothetical protein
MDEDSGPGPGQDEVARSTRRKGLRRRAAAGESKKDERASVLREAELFVPKADFVQIARGDSLAMYWRDRGWQRALVTGVKRPKTGARQYVCEYAKGACTQTLDLSRYHTRDTDAAEHGDWLQIWPQRKQLRNRDKPSHSNPTPVKQRNQKEPGRASAGIDEFIPEKILKVPHGTGRQCASVLGDSLFGVRARACVRVCACVCVGGCARGSTHAHCDRSVRFAGRSRF